MRLGDGVGLSVRLGGTSDRAFVPSFKTDSWSEIDGLQATDTPSPFYIPPSSGTAPNGKLYYNWDQVAEQIDRINLSWSSLGSPVTITYAYRSAAPDTMPEDTAGFTRFTAAQIAATETALQLWADVANITFTRIDDGDGYSNNAAILLGDYATGKAGASGFAFYPGDSASGSVAGDVWINVARSADWDAGEFVTLHELGHAIGLAHPGDYNSGSNSYDADAVYYQDSRMYTVMSSWGAPHTGGSSGINFSTGPQLHDIAAVQRLYGANMTTRTGDTIYGFNSNTGLDHFSITSASALSLFSIWDAGGNDTLDLSGYSTDSDIDLRPESFSSAGPDGAGAAIYNISIARGVIIENAYGGSGDDNILGNNAANLLLGNGGADTLNGGAGNDTLCGGAGADTLDGGNGSDTASYADAAAPVHASLATPASNSGDAAGDTYIAVENLLGSAFVDVLTGDANANVVTGGASNDLLYGNDGNDTLTGGAGADKLTGGAGVDAASYATAGAGVVANLFDHTLNTGDAAGDIFSSIEVLIGSDFNDTLVGTSAANRLDGGAGADTMIGGAGADTYTVDNVGDVVSETLSASGGIDKVQSSISYQLGANVENLTLIGSAAINGTGNTLANVITGNSAANALNGGAGDDTLNGGGGADTMKGGAGNDTFIVDNVGDKVSEDANNGADTVQSSITYQLGSNLENLTLTGSGAINGAGNTLANIITGNSGVNILNGGAGNDTLAGGAGHDTLKGGAGQDHFVFASLNAADSDSISDFSITDDRIDLDNSVFTALGPDGALSSDAFWSSTTGVAHDADDRVIYNSATGQLYYDADGNGAGVATLIATLTAHPTIDPTNFGII